MLRVLLLCLLLVCGCKKEEAVPMPFDQVPKELVDKAQKDMPDVAFVTLGFPSGTIANVHLAWLAPTKLRQTLVVGSRKMVVYDDTSGEPVRIHDSGAILDDPESFGEYRLTYRTGPIVSPPVEAIEPLSLELADFCRAVHTGGQPRSSAAIGLAVVQMIEAVDHAFIGLDPVVLPTHSRSRSGRAA